MNLDIHQISLHLVMFLKLFNFKLNNQSSENEEKLVNNQLTELDQYVLDNIIQPL